ncbi:MAG: MbnP family protein [Saprospiraceae bacterium]
MNKVTYFIALLALAFLPACHEHDGEPRADFTVTFRSHFAGEQLTKYKKYPFGLAGIPLQFTRFSTFLSDIELIKSDGSSHRLSEIEYIDFTPENASTDLSATPTITYRNVPEGEYIGLRIGYGVKPLLNAKDPTDFDYNHPLAKEIEYWSGWNSYIFTKIEGKVDSDNNGAFDVSLLYHIGSDALYKVYEFAAPIHVHTGEPGITVNFDLEKIFTMDDGTYYDIVTNFYTSNSPNDVVVAQVLAHNFEKATTVVQ